MRASQRYTNGLNAARETWNHRPRLVKTHKYQNAHNENLRMATINKLSGAGRYQTI